MRDTAGMMLHHQTTARNCTFSPKQPKSSARALPGLRVTASCLPFPHQPRVPLLASTNVSGTMVSKSVCASTAADHASAAFRDMLIRAHERTPNNRKMRPDVHAFRLGRRPTWIEIDGSRNPEVMAVADREHDGLGTPTSGVFVVTRLGRL
jgi:hypothetical protein